MQRSVLALCLLIAFTNLSVNAIVCAETQEQNMQSLLGEARAAQSRGNFAEAAQAYRKAVALDPTRPELWANLGIMYYESDNHPEAIKSFQQASRLNPSLFVPQLFLGLEYLHSNKPEQAAKYLENAVKLNPSDLQAAHSLGKAYAAVGDSKRATELYLEAVRLDPNKGDLWFDLGTSYLLQVENDARLMTSTYRDSAYVKLRSAEVLAAEGKLIEAEKAYKAAIALEPPVPCRYAELGITLLRQQKIAEAQEQFEHELQSSSQCGLAVLGQMITDVISGKSEAAVSSLTRAANADPAFVRSNLPLFRGALTEQQVRSFIATARDNAISSSPIDLPALIESAFVSDELPPTSNAAEDRQSSITQAQSLSDAHRFAAEGRYSRCSGALKPALQGASTNSLQLLAFCSFYTADYQTTSLAAQKLKNNPATRAPGLYWESKADQNLAIQALSRAGEIDANSPRMHVLLGNVFRQQHHWDDAEAEYRKAIALDPRSHSARLSLAITLFSELKNDEAFSIDESLLKEDPADAEANLFAAEILVQRNQFAQAEPYLQKCASLKPELLPRYHVLLGRVYAETDRVPAAIQEYKMGLSTDQDGSLHYQLARLYQQSGNKAAADDAFKESRQLVKQWNGRALGGLQQMGTDASRH
jgi:tetratricopeptide (TPR) repeat protein